MDMNENTYIKILQGAQEYSENQILLINEIGKYYEW